MIASTNSNRLIHSHENASIKDAKSIVKIEPAVDTADTTPAVVVCFQGNNGFCGTSSLDIYTKHKIIRPSTNNSANDVVQPDPTATDINTELSPVIPKTLEQLLENSTKRLVHYADKHPVTKKIIDTYDNWFNQNAPGADVKERFNIEYFNKFLQNHPRIEKRADEHMKFFNVLFNYGQKILG